jgi:hypothetical protein
VTLVVLSQGRLTARKVARLSESGWLHIVSSLVEGGALNCNFIVAHGEAVSQAFKSQL